MESKRRTLSHHRTFGRPTFLQVASTNTLRLCAFVLYFASFSTLANEDKQVLSEEEKAAWLDTSHRYVTGKADSLAYWMNDFFGDVSTEEEAPYSTLRLRVEQEWDQENQFDSDIKVRGKVYLPSLNKRLSLLFNEEDDNTTDTDDQLLDERDTPDSVSLQYEARNKERYRIDFRVGLRSSLYPKVSARYKYEYPIQENLIGTFSEEVLYLGDDGFASKTRIELDKALGKDRLLQWHNKLDWEEELSGFLWSSALSIEKRLSDKKAYAYFLSINGETEPSSLVNTYAVGIRYRQNIFRPWLFAEVKPSYRWSKAEAGLPRENAAVILFRLEIVFKRDLDRQFIKERNKKHP